LFDKIQEWLINWKRKKRQKISKKINICYGHQLTAIVSKDGTERLVRDKVGGGRGRGERRAARKSCDSTSDNKHTTCIIIIITNDAVSKLSLRHTFALILEKLVTAQLNSKVYFHANLRTQRDR